MVLATVLLQAVADADRERTQHRLDAYERLAEKEAFFTP
jgi:hypothetical protein